MERWARRCSTAVLLMLAVTLSGCDLSWLTVQIPDFDSKKVQGVWVWRQSEKTGAWVHDVRIDFDRVRKANGLEWLDYETVTGTLGERGVVAGMLERTPGKTDEVKVSLGFLRLSPPGSFRVSTFNAMGESPVSTASKHL